MAWTFLARSSPQRSSPAVDEAFSSPWRRYRGTHLGRAGPSAVFKASDPPEPRRRHYGVAFHGFGVWRNVAIASALSIRVGAGWLTGPRTGEMVPVVTDDATSVRCRRDHRLRDEPPGWIADSVRACVGAVGTEAGNRGQSPRHSGRRVAGAFFAVIRAERTGRRPDDGVLGGARVLLT